MERNRRFAIYGALLFLMQLSVLLFSFDSIITKDASIAGALLPLVMLQAAGVAVFLLGIAVSGVVLKRYRDSKTCELWANLAPGLISALWIVITIGSFAAKKLLQTKELGLLLAELLIVVILMITNVRFKKNSWYPAVTGIALTQFVFIVLASLYYSNEIFSAGRMLTMYVLILMILLPCIWGKEKTQLVMTGIAIVFQAVVTLVEFYQLNTLENILSAASRISKGMSVEQLLSAVAIVLIVFLVITIALQFARSFSVIGKVTAIVFSCFIMLMVNVIGSIESNASEIIVDVNDAVNKVEYYVYVSKKSGIEELSQLKGKSIGIHFEHSEAQIKDVASKLDAAAMSALKYHEVDSVSELLTAYDSGTIQAFILDTGTIDDMDAELEMRGEDRVISEEMKVIYTLQLDFVKDENEEQPPSIDSGTNIDANLSLSVQPFVVYVSGIDVYGSITTKSRSDVNVLAVVNPQTKEIALISTPRDAYLEIPGKTTDLRDKLTHAGNYGVAYSIATLENLYGVNIDFFIRLNFTSMEAIVDLLDGIDVYSHYDFTSRFHKYHFDKGINHMNGSQALAFARERKTVTGGDTTRGKHHIELIKGIFAKATKTSFLVNYQSLLSEVKENMQTNMNMDQLADLVAMQLKDGAQWHFTSYATTGKGVSEYCSSYRGSPLYVNILNSASVQKASNLMVRVLNGEKIPDGEITFDE